MKKYLIVFGLIIAGLSVLLPFVSTSPDGLQSIVASTEAQESTWSGLLGDYAIVAISNPYLSTLVSAMISVASFFSLPLCSAQKFLLKRRVQQPNLLNPL